MATPCLPGLVIRPATDKDIDTIARYGAAIAQETEDLTLETKVITAGVAAAIADPSKARYLIAEVDGAPVGSLMLQKEWSDWRNAEYWWIHSVYVVQDHRGTGTFKAMYEYVEKEAREAGAAGLKLYTETTNERAQKAYTKMGMENHALVFENVWLKH
ncbi:Protein PhnO [Auxenochlorella protothecoides]|nr:Protein PhnO [Auxenochlorella protothecoides]KFM22421.1 Protein PhnO [Auxenochlorella protothecoides]